MIKWPLFFQHFIEPLGIKTRTFSKKAIFLPIRLLEVSFKRKSKQKSEDVLPIFSLNNLYKKVRNDSWGSIECLILSQYKIKLQYKILTRDGFFFYKRIILTDWIFDLLKSSLYSCRMSVFDQKMSQVMVKVQFEKKIMIELNSC